MYSITAHSMNMSGGIWRKQIRQGLNVSFHLKTQGQRSTSVCYQRSISTYCILRHVLTQALADVLFSLQPTHTRKKKSNLWKKQKEGCVMLMHCNWVNQKNNCNVLILNIATLLLSIIQRLHSVDFTSLKAKDHKKTWRKIQQPSIESL